MAVSKLRWGVLMGILLFFSSSIALAAIPVYNYTEHSSYFNDVWDGKPVQGIMDFWNDHFGGNNLFWGFIGGVIYVMLWIYTGSFKLPTMLLILGLGAVGFLFPSAIGGSGVYWLIVIFGLAIIIYKRFKP